jgi:hypothetical protein
MEGPDPRGVIARKGMARRIREVGVSLTVLTTDVGQTENPSPAEGTKTYLDHIVRFGLSQKETDQMVRATPAGLLSLS